MSGFPVAVGDALQLSALSSLGGINVTVSGYLRTAEGALITFQRALTPPSNRTVGSLIFPLADGELLNLTASITLGAPITGQVFARVRLVRGLGTIQTVIASLIAGYVTEDQPIAWPGGRVQNSLEGQGNIRSIAGTDPAAGVEISETVPAGARWRVRSIRFPLVTDATAANREVVLVVDDGTTAFARIPSGASQAATLTHSYTFALGTPKIAPGVALAHALPFPDVLLRAGSRIATATANIQAGDNYGAPQLMVEEWLEVTA